MSTAAPPAPAPAPRPQADPTVRRRQIVAAVLGGIALLFAVLNLDEVSVNWLLGTWETPLIIVIVVSFLLGAGVGFFLRGRRLRQRVGR